MNIINIDHYRDDCFIKQYISKNSNVLVGKHPLMEKHYILSNGTIYSKMKDELLKTSKCHGHGGYERIRIKYDQKTKNCRVHRLVAETFIDNPENKLEVDHINTDRYNNNVSNLRWATRKENMNNLKCHQEIHPDTGEINPNFIYLE